MTGSFIPGDSAPNYQRWEPEPLDGKSLRLPTAEALEDIHQRAHEEGYRLGFEEGRAAGYRQGEEQAIKDVRRLKELLDALETALQQLGQSTSEQLLDLALEISRQMLRQALKVKPELLMPVVRSVVESIPQHAAHPHLYLHPEDAALVRASMQAELGQSGWRIVEDHRIERGGCRIETAVAEVDATIASRWQHLTAALGRDVSWLDHEPE